MKFDQKEQLSKLGTFESIEHIAPNQTKLYFEYGWVFMSYDSVIIVKIYDEGVFLGANHDYSTTTSKYRNSVLGVTGKEFNKLLKDGNYQLMEVK